MKLFYRFRKDDGTFPLDSESKVFMRGQRLYEKQESSQTRRWKSIQWMLFHHALMEKSLNNLTSAFFLIQCYKMFLLHPQTIPNQFHSMLPPPPCTPTALLHNRKKQCKRRYPSCQRSDLSLCNHHGAAERSLTTHSPSLCLPACKVILFAAIFRGVTQRSNT